MHRYLDAEKALEVIVYISKKTDNLFNIVKTLYYADKLHLQRYGRLITGDKYIAMDDGPVPSGAYDLIKVVRGDDFSFDPKITNAHPEKAIEATVKNKKTYVYPLRSPILDLLSESDIECLDEAIHQFASMPSNELWQIVHQEKAYNKTKKDETIPLRDLISLDLPNGAEVLEYLDS